MKALELNPQHCEAASYVGELYLQIERFEKAAAAYSRLQALSLCTLALLLALLIALRIASLTTLRCFLEGYVGCSCRRFFFAWLY